MVVASMSAATARWKSRRAGLSLNSSNLASTSGTSPPIRPTRKPFRSSRCRSSGERLCSSISFHSLPLTLRSPRGQRTKTMSTATLSHNICDGCSGDFDLGRLDRQVPAAGQEQQGE